MNGFGFPNQRQCTSFVSFCLVGMWWVPWEQESQLGRSGRATPLGAGCLAHSLVEVVTDEVTRVASKKARGSAWLLLSSNFLTFFSDELRSFLVGSAGEQCHLMSIKHNGFFLPLTEILPLSGKIQESILTYTCADLTGIMCFRSICLRVCVCV